MQRRIDDLEGQRIIYSARLANWQDRAIQDEEVIDQLQTAANENALPDGLTKEYAGEFLCTAYCTEEYPHICGTGDGITATVIDMGNRFRLIVNDVECIKSKPLPKLPVASALWIPMPNFEIGAGAWILAGGTHHSCFSYDLTPEYWEDYAEMAGIEMVHINKNTTISEFKKELRYNEVYYMLNK